MLYVYVNILNNQLIKIEIKKRNRTLIALRCLIICIIIKYLKAGKIVRFCLQIEKYRKLL